MKQALLSSITAAALGLAGMASYAQKPATQGDMPQKSTPSQAAKPVQGAAGVLVVVPLHMANDRFANGCWVRFHDHKDFRGATLTLAGPIDMPKMDVPGPAWRDWDSAIVGPKATVSTFDNENFRDRTATLGPGAHIADLREGKLGWFDEVHSARVTCLS